MSAANIPSRKKILLVGNAAHQDFHVVLSSIGGSTDWDVVDDLHKVPDETVDLAVLLIRYPNELRAIDVEQFRQRSPKCRVVAIMGSWCEGQLRNGQLFPLVEHVYWHQFSTWWHAFDEESATRPSPSLAGFGPIVIHTASREAFRAISDFLKSKGWESSWYRAGRRRPEVVGAAAFLWDGAQLESDEIAELAQCCQEFPDVPIVALCDYPRWHAVKAARELGVHEVLGKPVQSDRLSMAIAAAIDRSRQSENELPEPVNTTQNAA